MKISIKSLTLHEWHCGAGVDLAFVAAEKFPNYVVILSEAKNLSSFSAAKTAERFFASLRMTT
jgi:hypothetical protein